MREDIQMRNAVQVITSYDPKHPLHLHLKAYCRERKQIGSKDRKILAALVFGYFRAKGNRTVQSIQQGIVKGATQPLLEGFYNYWKDKIETDDGGVSSDETYFPLFDHISAQVEKTSFIKNHFDQPKIWIRCKRAMQTEIITELKNRKYEFEVINERTISFSQNYPLDQLPSFVAGYFEMQDIASQQTDDFFHPQKNEAWWDCCAGAGGKSLLLLEKQPQIQLFVSDIRPSILQNLRERLNKNGFLNYNTFVTDLLLSENLTRLPLFDGVIADVSCSGSGTWARSPEWLSYFKKEMLDHYVDLQRKIISNVQQKLKPGGQLIYITCSVYADENENNVAWFTENFPLQLNEEKYIQYSVEGGDTMFVARLVKL